MPITTKSGFSRPTFEELRADQMSAYALKFGAFADDAVEARLAEIDAEMAHSLYGYIEHEAQNFMPMYATGPRMKDWGDFLIGPMKGASAALGAFTISGADGTPLAVNTRLVRGDGVEFVVSTGGIVAGGSVTVPIHAAISGLAGNTAGGVALSLVNPVLGLDPAGAVTAPGLTGGAEAETDDGYRARYLIRLREPPAGGNDTDYRTWALQVAGITRAWVRRGASGTGEVVILVMTDGSTVNGIPVGDGSPSYTGDLRRVYDHIEAVAPSPGVRYVKAPVPKVINVTVKGLDPDTPEVRAAIAAELADMFLRRAEAAKTMRKSWFAEAVAVAAGTDGFDEITSPAATVICAEDEIAVLGVISYDP